MLAPLSAGLNWRARRRPAAPDSTLCSSIFLTLRRRQDAGDDEGSPSALPRAASASVAPIRSAEGKGRAPDFRL
jgi:hypothetical protein